MIVDIGRDELQGILLFVLLLWIPLFKGEVNANCCDDNLGTSIMHMHCILLTYIILCRCKCMGKERLKKKRLLFSTAIYNVLVQGKPIT